MQFSTVEKTEHLFQLQKHTLPEELNAIINMQYHSGRNTMLGDALSQINNEVFNGQAGDRSTVENVLVIFSDGRAHDISRAYREAGYMKEKDVRIIATAVSDSGYIPEELRRLATHRKDVLAIDLSNSAHYAKELASMICKANA
ncbi:collagen alpha-1(XIV) chain-like [Dendronephthya gigantea]|uniref:collagen alpha-1(XIV) chain-like n=1 Tax=Dendronephthya gigantea TaxID=151771 RepID=UPI00106D92F4|nr:collagen alpha-1(XIV) chain-like [Dendronephthya gigantea]